MRIIRLLKIRLRQRVRSEVTFHKRDGRDKLNVPICTLSLQISKLELRTEIHILFITVHDTE